MAKQPTRAAGVSPALFDRTTMTAAVFGGPQKIDFRSVPMPALLTHSYPLDELSQAMRDMEERPEGFMKGWIRYD